MRKILFLFATLVVACFVSSSLTPAFAQARTWVSGTGDDANPCSRTAPCKTFAGAISKTQAGGEINCIDPGGFGGVTITKAIIISCEIGTAGVQVSGTNGITVNAGAADVVYLKGLDFEGIGTGLNGISFLNGKSLHVEKCMIRGFTTNAINFAPNNVNASFVVQDSVVADNIGGILVAPMSGFTANGLVKNTRMTRNTYGVRAQDNSKVTVNNSEASSNTNNGFLVVSTSAAAIINLVNSVSSNNGTNGIQSSGANALIRLDYSSIFDNASSGISLINNGVVTSTSPATTLNSGTGTPNGSAIPLQ